MTGSALSLYLEETKTSEDSVFQSEISPIKSEAISAESKNNINVNISTGTKDGPSRGKGDPCDILSPTVLALHKVVWSYFICSFEKVHLPSLPSQTFRSPATTITKKTT